MTACVWLAIVSFSVTAGAQDSQPSPAQIKQAARAFDNAREAYGSEDYETAADQFEKADGHAPSAVALQWAIDAHHQAGHKARAATLAALAKQRHADVTELSELADRVIAEWEAELLEVQVVCEEACELLVDNKIVHGRPATARTLYLDPGQYTVRASFGPDRMSASEDVHGEADQTASVMLAPPQEKEQKSPEASTEGMSDPFAEAEPDDPLLNEGPKQQVPSGWSSTIFWTGLSLTGVSALVTTWSGLDTQKNPGKDEVREKCRGLDASCPEYQDGLSRQKRTNVLLGVTGGLAAFTVVAAALTDWSSSDAAASEAVRRKPSETAWSVQPWASVGSGAALGATGRF